MKRLLGLLLVMGIVEGRQKQNAGNAIAFALQKLTTAFTRDDAGEVITAACYETRLNPTEFVHCEGLTNIEPLTRDATQVTMARVVALKTSLPEFIFSDEPVHPTL